MKRTAIFLCALALAALADDKPGPKKEEKPGPKKEEKPAPEKKLEGNVVDWAGVLQPGVEIAASWTWEGGKAAPNPPSLKADANGHFEFPYKNWPGNFTAVAYDASREKGCLLPITEELAKKPVTLRLGPLVKVRARLVATSAEVPLPPDAEVRIQVAEGGAEIAKVKAGADGAVAFRVPAGKYKLLWSGDKFLPVEREFDAKADLGDVKLDPTPLAVGVGKTLPPFHAAAVRGGKPDLQIADFKGKWVMVLFWGSWCNTSSREWVPTLVECDRRLKEKYTNYQILAYHDATAKSWDEMEEKLAGHKITWDPKKLPFPLLLDAQEKGTVKSWGVSGEPIVLLFDPEGKFVSQGREYVVLEKALRAEAK